jgi:hypothetical protein
MYRNLLKKRLLLTLVLLCALLASAESPKSFALRQGMDKTAVLTQVGTDFGFFMPETGGYLKTGLLLNDKSLWLKNAESLRMKKSNRGWELTIKDSFLGNGILYLCVQPLSDSNGLVLQVNGSGLPEGLQFLWVYGGCSADSLPSEKTAFLLPGQCYNNVFSREINAFTVYYGQTVKLKVMMGLAPLTTETRLSDARQMASPLALWISGKKTDAPVLAATNPLMNGENFYYCFYRQNQKADYNYYMLPALFEKEAGQKAINTNENAKPHTDFGPDFHQH